MIALALALHLSGSAFACEGHDKAASGSGKGCPMAAAEATAQVTAPVPTSGAHVALTVSGMTCASCASVVHAALMKVDGVTGAQVLVETGAVQVAYDAAKANPEKLLAAVTAIGEFTVKLATN